MKREKKRYMSIFTVCMALVCLTFSIVFTSYNKSDNLTTGTTIKLSETTSSSVNKTD